MASDPGSTNRAPAYGPAVHAGHRRDGRAPARTERRLCTLREGPPRAFSPSVGGDRLRLILQNASKWVNGTALEYAFFPGDGPTSAWAGSEPLRGRVREAFRVWTDVGIGLRFTEVPSPQQAQVRIGFLAGDGHWSYLGRDVLRQRLDDRTMNLDPADGIVDAEHGLDVACHEIGHTLGLPHEHQNPNAGIVWDEEAVYAALAKPPNGWTREQTFHNVLRKIPADEIQGSRWDPDSVMHYPFAAGLILEPERYRAGLVPPGGLSARDREWIRTFYPPLAPAEEEELPLREARRLQLPSGRQRTFLLRPAVSRSYEIRTLGASDSALVLSLRDPDGTEHDLAGDDDGGEDRNASLRRRLLAGRSYVLRLRLYYAADSSETAVIWF